MKNGTCAHTRNLARPRIYAVVAGVVLALVLSLAAYAGPVVDPAGKTNNHSVTTDASAHLDGAAGGDPGFLGQVIVFLTSGADKDAFAKDNGLTYLYTLQSDVDAHVYFVGTPAETAAALESLSANPLVRAVYENRRADNVRFFPFVPNDPYFHRDTPAPGWSGQWHLKNEWTPGLDVNIWPAWNKGMTGLGVKMAVVDDCLQKTHPDLAPNYDAADSWDFGQSDADPSPVYSYDMHGICTAGVAAARGGNGIGVTGAAPYAQIAGLRVDFTVPTDAEFVDATLYHSSGLSNKIKIKNHSYGVTAPYGYTPAQTAAITTSTAASTIHVFAAGNDRGAIGGGEDSNKKMNQASADSITVAALGSDGIYASYSCFGANVFCTAPSISFPPGGGLMGITTTDRTGSWGYNGADPFPDEAYTSSFGGTSSSAPLVAGVIAVADQVQPALNTRLVKHLLARTCVVVDPADASPTSDAGWKTNAAGFKFNQDYGFGLIDADALCLKARQYCGVTPLETAVVPLVTVVQPIPDNDPTGLTQTFNIANTTPLEQVLIHIKVIHTRRGDFEAYLTSPSGTTSRLMYRSTTDPITDPIDWTFSTNAFWGEVPTGTWTLKLVDTAATHTGTWVNYTATLNMGLPILCNDPLTVTINQASFQGDPTGNSFVYFTVHFNKWVTDFTAADVAISGTSGATTAGIVQTVSGGQDYRVAISGMNLHGTVIAGIPAGTVHDANGNPNLASTSTDNTVTYNGSPKNVYTLVRRFIPPLPSSVGGTWYTVASAYYDPNGAKDLLKAYLLINDTLGDAGGVGVKGAYMMYDCLLNKLYLKNDAGTSWGKACDPGSSVILSNSQCSLDAKGTTVAFSADGKYMLVKWLIQTTDSFTSVPRNAWMFVQDTGFLHDGWDLMSTFP